VIADAVDAVLARRGRKHVGIVAAVRYEGETSVTGREFVRALAPAR